jgi:sec-independent protein translocase protein TatB
MLDIGWTELLVIGVVALLVVPPKDLPALLRTVGKYMGQMRRLATDFRSQFDQALRESELAEIRDTVKAQGSAIQSSLRSAEASLNSDYPPKSSPEPEPAKPVPDNELSSTATPERSAAFPAFAGASTGTPPAAAPAVGAELIAAEATVPDAVRAPVAQRAAEAWKASASGDSGA